MCVKASSVYECMHVCLLMDGGEKRSKGRGNSTWSYRSPGAPSRRCCRQAWSARSGPPAAPAARSAGPTTTWSWASLTPPGRCRSSCAGTRPAGPAPDWPWRRSLGGGGAVTKGESRAGLVPQTFKVNNDTLKLNI